MDFAEGEKNWVWWGGVQVVQVKESPRDIWSKKKIPYDGKVEAGPGGTDDGDGKAEAGPGGGTQVEVELSEIWISTYRCV